MHARDGDKKKRSPERPSTAPASCGSEYAYSYQNSLASTFSSGDSESTLGISDTNRPKSEVSAYRYLMSRRFVPFKKHTSIVINSLNVILIATGNY